MNQNEGHVVAVLGKPYRKFSGWCIDVEYVHWRDDLTKIRKATLTFHTEDGALAIKPGYRFLC